MRDEPKEYLRKKAENNRWEFLLLDHGGSRVQIPSRARIFFRVSI